MPSVFISYLCSSAFICGSLLFVSGSALNIPLSPLRLVVLISGGGTTLRNLLEKIAAGKLDAKIDLVISSSAKVGGLKIAADAGIPTRVIERIGFASDDDYSMAVFVPCREVQSHLVVMAGFLKFVPIPPDFEYRVVNIHPALIPAFCVPAFTAIAFTSPCSITAPRSAAAPSTS